MYKYECTCIGRKYYWEWAPGRLGGKEEQPFDWSIVLLFITRGGRSPALAANAGSEKPRAEKEEKDK